jgi:hypothetical protein
MYMRRGVPILSVVRELPRFTRFGFIVVGRRAPAHNQMRASLYHIVFS